VRVDIVVAPEQEQAMTALPPKRLQMAQVFMAAVGRSDVETAVGLLSTKATYRVEGVHALSGTFSADQIVDHLLTMIRRTAGTFDVTKFDDWLVGELYVGCVVQVTFHAEGRRYSGHVMFLFRFDRADLIDKVMVFFEDSDGVSRFFGGA
jgi:ketosteroid isomerase-like protein